MNHKYKENFFRAGQIAKEVRLFGKSLIRKGASYCQTIQQIEQKIVELGAIAAFPPQIALDEIAAHYLPEPGQDIIFSDEVVKLDVGICYDGAIGDCAVTVDLSGKHQILIEAVEQALLAAEKILRVGLPVREIGKVIEETITSYNLKPVKNLSGHGLGYYKIHTTPNIPNYYDQSKAVLSSGMTFAIEPFATDGVGYIYEDLRPMIFSQLRPLTKQLGIPQALHEKIESYKRLPFSFHNLLDCSLSVVEVQHHVERLEKLQYLCGYPPLIEEAQGLVAQAENSVLIDEKGQVFVTTRY